MTLPPVIRIFFAIDLSQSVRDNLGHFISALKKKSKTHAVRWTKPENLHITLQFLAEVQTEHLKGLIDNVRAEIEGIIHCSTLTFGGVHLFPNPYRPRVIVLGVTPQEELATLSGLIGHGIKASSYEVESRPFRAHLTLGRIKNPQGLNLSFLSEFSQTEAGSMEVNEVVLFRSEPRPEGSEYTVVDRITLVPGMLASQAIR